MRYFLTIITITLFTLSAWAQPDNDDCTGLIDLGLAPFCTDDFYTNIDATTTDIGFGNNPSCFNGGTAQRDVFFSFTVDPSLIDLTISVNGTALGPNGISISNPQVALYRGSCMTDGLAELLCASADIGETTVHLDAIGLTPGIPYFIRINDFSSTGTPNSGDFQVCVEEYIPAINIGEEATSAACFGTLYDSGGPDDDYSNGENNTFTVCPTDFTQCIAIDVVSFGIENSVDFLNIFAGSDITAPSITSLTGTNSGNDFEILATSACVTFQFTSDGSATNEGFEVTWQCSASACEASSFTNTTPITGIPFNEDGFTTCGAGATLNETPCGNTPFLNGPETVFAYTSEGGYCATVAVTNAEPGTGVLVLNGPLSDPETVCLGVGADGSASNIDFQEAGVYYIVVANGSGCTEFGLTINESLCTLPTSLADALCNPLNGCADAGMVSEFIFEDGFQDIPLNQDVNDGCWGGVGAESDYVWFSIQASADGPFGFILDGTNFASDIDFNVWGPFTVDEVCETPQVAIDAATNTQPIRSSYAGGADPTGLADVHPTLGTTVEDVYDCDGNNDDFVQTIAAQEGEVYIVLANDWGNNIEDGGISVDWGPSDPDVIGPFEVSYMVAANDTSICAGENVLLDVVTVLDNIEWIGDNTDELSCTDCFTPTATPSETRVYKAVLENTCYNDTIEININVFALDAGPDYITCIGEEFDIPAGQDFETATYTWSPPAGLEFSCTDCPTPSVVSQVAGVYEVPVTLIAEACEFMDMITVTVLDNPAPEYVIADDVHICVGESVSLGGAETPDHTFSWEAVPVAGPIADIANPSVMPDTTTTYYLSVSNNQCPVPSLDSVTVSVSQFPIIDIVEDENVICQGDMIELVNIITESDVTYSWAGNNTISNPDSVYTQITPESTGTYTLTGDRLGCQSEDTFNVDVIRAAISLNQPDSTLICFGEQVAVMPTIEPEDATIEWNQVEVTTNNPTLSPSTNTTYIATVTNQVCVAMDTMYIQVDSIPMDMSITADPMEDSYCQGELVQLTSPIYEPANYPHITHEWEGLGMETSDTLYNLVLTTTDTFTYIRATTSGACAHSDSITLNVITPEVLTITPANPEICPGESVDLLLTADALGELEWSPAGSLSCSDCPNPTATPGDDTTEYTVSSDIGGCPVETSVTITVLEAPTLSLINDQTACAGTTFDVLNNQGVQAGTTYSWTSSIDPAFTSNEVNISAVAGEPTTYTATATNTCGEISQSVTISQVEIPVLTLPQDLTVCLESTFNLAATIENGQNVTSEVWIYDGESELGASVDFIATTSGEASFNLEYGPEGGDACGVLSGVVNVNVVDQVYTIDIETDPTPLDTIYGGTVFTLNALVDPPTGFDYTYNWLGNGVVSPDMSLTMVNAPNPTADPDSTIQETYILNVSTPEGCDQTALVSVVIIPVDFEIPNIFSPNGDTKNEVFRLFTNSLPTEYSLKVFNRWGQLVFETNDPSEGWDGNIDGNPAPSDVYIYQMEATSPNMPDEPIRGQVTLIR